MAERVSVIVNPAAGRGRGARMVPQIMSAFAEVDVVDVRLTSASRDEAEIARHAIDRGATTIIVAGGDGTTTHVANAILNSGEDTRLGIIPLGTGNDFAKVLGSHNQSMKKVARLSVETGNARVDVGKIEDIYFLNCCGFGFDVAVLEATARNRYLRGNAVYLYSALRELLGYRGIDLTRNGESMRHLLLVIANTEYFGGMFRIAPGARPDDGELDLVAIKDVPSGRRVAMLSAATRGEHFKYDECAMERAASFTITFPMPPAFESDGELHQAMSSELTVSSCASALRVLTAAN